MNIMDEMGKIAQKVQEEFKQERRVLSFQEYLELVAGDPIRYCRDASRYLKDVFDHFGRETVAKPWGNLTRFKLFDLGWLEPDVEQRESLIGQEAIQAEIYRTLSNFVRESRPTRLILMHGPNGSSKSTVVRCMMRALEHYSVLDVGALYRFHWVFPNKSTLRGSIGFGDKAGSRGDPSASYAHLDEDAIDSRLFVELRDHPVFLIPNPERREFLANLYRRADVPEEPSNWIANGRLSHKNKQVFDALFASYGGDLQEVLRHVQVERYFISRRYRLGAVTVGPQLSVDAGERQITADRSIGALPTSLRAVALFEAFGELVDAAGGILEFSDLLKRPLDAFKYLQHTAETGEVSLTSQNIRVNCVMLGSANEVQLEAFRQHHEFESFRGRLELIRAPYLRSYEDEQAIYDSQIAPQVRAHVAPHATEVAAMFAVLTRMRKPNPDRYEKPLKELVSELTAMEKMDLYSTGATPNRLDEDSAKLLRAAIQRLYVESDSYTIFEGSIGASPREMRTVLLDAAQNPHYECLSPFAVLEELDKLCEKVSEYVWLQEEAREGDFHDHEAFRRMLRERLLDALEGEFRVASGLVDDDRYRELFSRYVQHVSFWVKGEKLRNPMTGAYEEPDQRLMEEVEGLIRSPDEPEQFRHSLINKIAAWAIDHPGEQVQDQVVFADLIRRVQDAVFQDRRGAVAKLCRDVVVLLREEGAGLDATTRAQAQSMVDRLKTAGYAESSAGDAAAALLRERFVDLLS